MPISAKIVEEKERCEHNNNNPWKCRCQMGGANINSRNNEQQNVNNEICANAIAVHQNNEREAIQSNRHKICVTQDLIG